jgi:outer membrane protein, adhesin transport system
MKKIQYLLMGTLIATSAQGTSLRDSIEDTLNANPSIIAEHINRDAYLKYVDQEEADYLPKVDLTSRIEKGKIHRQRDTGDDNWIKYNGWNSNLKLEHILYDGGLTSSQVEEFKHQYTANKLSSMETVENTIYDTVEAYIDLLKAQELMALSQNNIKIHEEYLQIAKDKEEISGEVLETYQVNSKYHDVLDRYLEEENDKKTALSLYKKLVGKKLKDDVCRPVTDETFVPTTLKEAVELGLRRSFKVNEQIAKINQQREKVVQERAGYFPTITFNLESTLDNDIELEENGREDTYKGSINLSWNLFSGGKTYHSTQKEELFLKEEQKRLDEVTQEVIDEITTAYNTFFMIKQRVENLKKYVDDNFNILKVYKKQLADGTRTFIDILNAESELYRSDLDEIDLELEYLRAYYDLMNKMSMLSDVILMEEKQICPKYKFVPRDTGIDKEEEPQIGEDLQNLFSQESTLQDSSSTGKTPTSVGDTQQKSIGERLDSIYNTNSQKVNTLSLQNNQTAKIAYKFTINLATLDNEQEMKKFLEEYKYQLDKTQIEKYRLGNKTEKVKLFYGKYKTIDEAKKVLKSFNKSLEKYVYIDNIEKFKQLKEI